MKGLKKLKGGRNPIGRLAISTHSDPRGLPETEPPNRCIQEPIWGPKHNYSRGLPCQASSEKMLLICKRLEVQGKREAWWRQPLETRGKRNGSGDWEQGQQMECKQIEFKKWKKAKNDLLKDKKIPIAVTGWTWNMFIVSESCNSDSTRQLKSVHTYELVLDLNN